MTTDLNRPGSDTAGRSAAASAGACVGLAYSLVENALLVWEPWLRLPAHAYVARHVGSSLLLVLLYALIGAASAVLLWTAGRRAPAALRRPEVAAAASFALLYAGALVIDPPDNPSERLGQAAAVCIVGAVLLGGWRPARALRMFEKPLAVAGLLLAPAWIIAVYLPYPTASPVRLAGAVTAAVLVLAVSALVARASTRSTRAVGVWGLAALLVAAGGGLLRQETRIEPVVGTPAPGAGPNLILISLDTVSAGHLSLYGYERDTTPNLRRLARESVWYPHSYSSGDMTLISHASMFTGLRPDAHGAHFGADGGAARPLSQDHETLAEILAAQGYRTAAVVANFGFFGVGYGLGQGFQYLDYRSGAPFLAPAPGYSGREILRRPLEAILEGAVEDSRTRRADSINATAFDLLDRFVTAGEPFFLFVNYMDAHWRYLPPPPFDTLFPGKMDRFSRDRHDEIRYGVLRGDRPIADAERAHLISQYDGSIAYLDAQLGLFIDRLRNDDLLDNTLLIITSDHGEAFGRREIGHGVSLYQNQIHVPLLIRFPDSRPARRSDAVVVSGDIFATALDYLEAPLPTDIQGVSLAGADPDAHRMVVSQSYPAAGAGRISRRFARVQTAVLSGYYKLIHSTNGEPELYDLAADPEEESNLYEPGHPVAAALAAALVFAGSADPAEDTSEPAPEALERLKSLGYLD